MKSTFGQTSHIPKGKPKVSSGDSSAESPPIAPGSTVQPARPPMKSTFGQTSHIPKGKPKVSSGDSSAESPPIAPGSTVQPAPPPVKNTFGQTSNIPKGKPSSPAPASQAPLPATVEADTPLSKSQTSPRQPPADNRPLTTLFTKAPFDINDQAMAWLDPSVPRPPGVTGHRSAAYNPLRDAITGILHNELKYMTDDLAEHIRHAASRTIEKHTDRVFVSTAVCHEALLEGKIREEATPRIEAELREELKPQVREQLVQLVYDEIRKEEREKCKAEFQQTLEQERRGMRATVLKENSDQFLDCQKKYDNVNLQYYERKRDLENINSEIRNQQVQQGILTKEIKSKMQTLRSLSSSKENEMEDTKAMEGQAQMNTLQNSTSSDHVPGAPLASSPPSEPAAAAGQSAAPQRPQLTSNTQAPGVSVATTTVTASPPSSTDDRTHTTNIDDANERLGFGVGSGAGVSRPPPVKGAQNLAAGSKRGRRRDSDSDIHRQSKRIKLEEDELATGENTHASIDRTRPSRDISGHIVDQTLYGVEDVIEHPGADDWSGLKAAHQSNSPPIDCEPRTSKHPEGRLGESDGRGQWEADNALKPQTVDGQASEAGPDMSVTDANEMAETMTTDRKAKAKRSTTTKTKKETAAVSALKQHTSEGVDDLVPIKEEAEEASVMEQPAKRRPGRPRKIITGQSVNIAPQAPGPAVVNAPTRPRRGPKTNTEPATVKLERVTDGRVQKQTTSRYPRRQKTQPQQMTVNREEEEDEEEL